MYSCYRGQQVIWVIVLFGLRERGHHAGNSTSHIVTNTHLKKQDTAIKKQQQQKRTRYKSRTDADIIFGELLLAVKVTEGFTPTT